MFNIAAVFICQALLCVYIFRTKPGLTAKGFAVEKKYLQIQTKGFAIVLSSVAVLYLLISLFLPFNPWVSELLLFAFIIAWAIMRRRIKKYKPPTVEDI